MRYTLNKCVVVVVVVMRWLCAGCGFVRRVCGWG